MARIRSKHTKPEARLRRRLWARGHRYRLHTKLPGTPDLTFPAARLALFVDGCFWHGCPSHCRRPASNSAYWNEKIDGNMTRDLIVISRLEALGWRTIRLWEHEISSDVEQAVQRVEAALNYTEEKARRPKRIG